MKCQKCGIEMQRVGIEHVEGEKVISEWECPACHCRIQQPAKP